MERFSQCSRYAVDWSTFMNETDLLDLKPNTSWPIETCVNGWIYNKTIVPSSIVIDVRNL